MSKRIPEHALRAAKRAKYNKALEELMASMKDVSSDESVTSERRPPLKVELAPGESVGEAEEHGHDEQHAQVQDRAPMPEPPMSEAPMPEAPMLLPVKIEPPSPGRLSVTDTLPLDLHCTGEAQCVCSYCTWKRDWFAYYPSWFFERGGPSGPSGV